MRTDIMSGLEVAVRLLHQDAAIKVARQIPQRKYVFPVTVNYIFKYRDFFCPLYFIRSCLSLL